MGSLKSQILLHSPQCNDFTRKTAKPAKTLMTRDSYLRITRLLVPRNVSAASLRLLALVSRPAIVVEGYLLEEIQIDAPIRFRACFQSGLPFHRNYISSEVRRIEGEFVQTCHGLFQILRVPPSVPRSAEPNFVMNWKAEEGHCLDVKPPSVRYEKKTLFRAELYSVPRNTGYPDLSTLAEMGYEFAAFEGYLRRKPMVGRKLNFLTVHSGSNPNRLIHISAPIVRHEGDYCLTNHCLYRLQQVPGLGYGNR